MDGNVLATWNGHPQMPVGKVRASLLDDMEDQLTILQRQKFVMTESVDHIIMPKGNATVQSWCVGLLRRQAAKRPFSFLGARAWI